MSVVSDHEIDNANSKQSQSDVPHYILQFFAVTNHPGAKIGWAKNAICMFCDKSSSGLNTPKQQLLCRADLWAPYLGPTYSRHTPIG